MNRFVHLNVHSHFSAGWGTSTVEEICRSAAALGMKYLSLTDTNGLYGAVLFVRTAREAGITPILGSEIVCPNGRRALLLAKDREGYANLCGLISDRHCHGRFDLIRSLRERRAGLVVCSDDFKLLKTLKRDGIEDLYVEMSPGYRMAACHSYSRASGIPPLATNRVFMARREQYDLHRILRAVDRNTTLSRLEPLDTCMEHNYLCDSGFMKDHFPHAPEAVENAVAAGNSCGVAWDWVDVVFPRFRDMDDREAFQKLRTAVMEGCARRYGEITPPVQARVDHEMKIIREKNFAHYFLVVADITARVPRSCGRGSAAASIVSYALGITHVEPVSHNLFFERFLNPDRMDPPDIDVDFPWDLILKAAADLEGGFANLSTHCGGLVVVPDDIRGHCPVEVSPGGPQVLQWEKDAVEGAGLVKIDILGNRSLSVIRDALAMVESNYGVSIPYTDLNPLRDRKAVEVFYRAETMGVFYFESPATRQVLTKVSSGMSFLGRRPANSV